MNSSSRLASAIIAVGLLSAPLASAQSIGRIKKSIDKATGGATAAPQSGRTAPGVPGVVVVDSTAAPQSQTAAAAEALAQQRNKKSQVGVDQRVIDFLKKRIEDGSADAAFDLGKRYEEGKGVAADPVEAWKLYSLSAERGNEEAKTWLETHPKPKELEKLEQAEKADKSVKALEAVPATPAKPAEK